MEYFRMQYAVSCFKLSQSVWCTFLHFCYFLALSYFKHTALSSFP